MFSHITQKQLGSDYVDSSVMPRVEILSVDVARGDTLILTKEKNTGVGQKLRGASYDFRYRLHVNNDNVDEFYAGETMFIVENESPVRVRDIGWIETAAERK